MRGSRFAAFLMVGFFTAAASGLSALEVGSDDFRISDMGPDGDVDFGASSAAVAYNGDDDEYLVVWVGDDTTVDEYEIHGQRIDAATGMEIGSDFRISVTGPEGNTSFSADEPAVAYNAMDHQYLVVWVGDENAEFEIYGQIVSRTSELIGFDFRISDMGPDGDSDFSTGNPAIAHNGTDNQYLVVWQGDDDTVPLVDNEREIFGQLLGSGGEEIGGDFRISDMGPDGDTTFAAQRPSVVYNSVRNEYLVVWDGDDDTAPLVDQEVEVFGQLLSAAGDPIGNNDFRVSDAGPDGDTGFNARIADAAYDDRNDRYFVVWQGDDDTAPLVNNDFEIFGRLLNADSSAFGAQIRISDAGPDGANAFQPTSASVVYNAANEEFVVVWRGDDDTGSQVFGENEILVQRLSGDGSEIGENDVRISHMGPDGDTSFLASSPALAPGTQTVLVVWSGDGAGGLGGDEFEVFGQLLANCGDGVVDAGEECDDANAADGDGCGATCQIEDEEATGGTTTGGTSGESPGGGCSLIRP